MMNNKISVIVPVYNTAEYLRACIDSILNQTYNNLECILVNDGSTDESGVICDDYQNKDKRIKVIHKNNEGLSSARNIALTQITGDYVAFVDSDDYIQPELYERMIHMMDDYVSDVAMCNYFSDESEEQISDPQILVLNKDTMMHRILTDEIGSQLWKYLFKKFLWDGILSPGGRHAQDMFVLHKVINSANQMVCTSEKLYYYYSRRPDNTSNASKNLLKNTLDRSLAFFDRYNYAIDNNLVDSSKIILNKATIFSINAIILWDPKNAIDRVDINCIIKLLRRNKEAIIQNELIETKKKIEAYMIIFNPLLFKIAYGIFRTAFVLR